MSKFRVSPQLARTIASVAGELRAELRQSGVTVKRDALIASIVGMITQAATGRRSRELTATSAPATYNRAGDILGLAHQTYLAKDYKNSLELVALAFQDPTSMDLIGAIIANNDEAKSDDEEHAGAFDNKLDDSNSDDDNTTTASLADQDIDVDDDDDDDDDDYTSDLNKAVDDVTAGLITAEADDDDDGEAETDDDDDDDTELSDDDDDAEMSGDDDDDDSADDDDDDDKELTPADDDDDDNSANAQKGLTGDNMPGMMAKLVRRINDPSIIAAANKVSISGSDKDRKKAIGFLASAANISRTKTPRRPNRK
jgi:hypothetical protein